MDNDSSYMIYIMLRAKEWIIWFTDSFQIILQEKQLSDLSIELFEVWSFNKAGIIYCFSD